MKKIIFLLSILFINLSFAQNSILQSGPMVGYCEMKEAVIWLQTNKNATIKVEYSTTDNPSKVFHSENYTSSKEVGYTYHIILDQLQPGKKYKYTVFIDNKKIILPYETSFSSKKLWEWRKDAPDFTIAFGSCMYINEPELDRPGKPYGSGYTIFESIAKKNPDIMIWGGDNTYLRESDWDSKTGIYHRNTHSRSIKEIQPLLAKTQNFAIWDDHDYGPDNSDRSFYNKQSTQKAFKDFWANKYYGMNPNQNEGVFSTFTWGDAQFFLIDGRFFRSPEARITGAKTMLGTTQFEWLIDALSASEASFKIVVIGGQILNTVLDSENYSHFPEEKEKLLQEITANKIKGIFFLSGDRHFAEMSMLPRNNSYPIYDWTVSPLTSGVASQKVLSEDNKYKVPGSAFVQHNFGTISFLGNQENRQMKLTLFDANGSELWNKTILKKELQ
ncbi:alkaline phosphatase D [Flavobacterium fryxellicola]|uniref:Phosphodiesterase n=1 Tax=Flavobacterium fryxellicola TaxID=249352 RepID=A0A167XS07_9FLAO|nr:alkaline phosphatase D family protein [Flavobacterium fryxellicola]OAB28636.1 phosphodiesterase [Flavobacterium fryxellicola]SHN51087.1 alkaline phosphatase D [Flavobacterium fryxellicola]